MTDLKKCQKCGVERELTYFSSNKRKSDGKEPRCKDCCAWYHYAYYIKNREKLIAQSAKWHRGNPEKVYAKQLRYYTESPGKRAAVAAKHKENNPRAGAEKSARHRAKNLEACRERDRLRSVLNPERERARHQRYRRENLARDCAKVTRRRAAKLNATPPWLTPEHTKHIEAVYAISAFLTERTGIQHHVDHSHPLRGKGFCGLHVPWNLCVLPAKENLRKNSRLPAKYAHLAWGSE